MSTPDGSSNHGLSSNFEPAAFLSSSSSILNQPLFGDLTRQGSQQLRGVANEWQVSEHDPLTGVGVAESAGWNEQKTNFLHGDEFKSGIPPIDAGAQFMGKVIGAVEQAAEASIPIITDAVSSTASNISESIKGAIDDAQSRWNAPDNQTRQTLSQKAEQVTESLKDFTADVIANGNVQNVLVKLASTGRKLSDQAEDALRTAQDRAEAFAERLLGQPDLRSESIRLPSVRKVVFAPEKDLLGRQAFDPDANFGQSQTIPFEADILVQAGLASTDGQLSREEVIAILRSTEDGGVIDAGEVNALKSLPSFAASVMPNYVRVLTEKVVLGDPANDRSGIGELTAGSYAIQMEGLIGKWFLGNDHPTALSYDHSQSFNYNPVEGQLFKYGVSHLDVTQGSLGDCYFLASLGAVALHSPETIQNMFIDNGDGTFTVRFYKNGVEDFVTVDRLLPTRWNGQAVFAGWGGQSNNFVGNELWVALAEKAYAQWNESGGIGQDNTNSYNGKFPPSAVSRKTGSGLNGGWAVDSLRQITGHNTAYSQMSTNLWIVPLSNTVDEMIQAHNRGEMIVLTSKVGEFGNETTHAYTLARYNAVDDRFLVYNPHGRFEQELSRDQIIEKFFRWDATVNASKTVHSGLKEAELVTPTEQNMLASTSTNETPIQEDSFSETTPELSKVSVMANEVAENEDELVNNLVRYGLTESELVTPAEQKMLASTSTNETPIQEDSFSKTTPELSKVSVMANEIAENEDESFNVHHNVDEGVGIEYQVDHDYQHRAQIGSDITLTSDASVSAQVKLKAGVKGKLDVNISSEGVTAQAEGEAFAGGKASVSAKGSTTIGINGTPISAGADGEGDAEALAGANAEGKAGLAITKDDISVEGGGSAFAGAEVSVEGSAGLSVNGEQVVEVGATAGVKAGVGASANVKAGYEDGKLHLGWNVGLGLGVGAEVGFDISVDVPEPIAKPVEKTIEVAGNVGEKVGEVAGNVGEEVGEVAGNVGEATGEVISAPVKFFSGLFGKKRRSAPDSKPIVLSPSPDQFRYETKVATINLPEKLVEELFGKKDHHSTSDSKPTDPSPEQP